MVTSLLVQSHSIEHSGLARFLQCQKIAVVVGAVSAIKPPRHPIIAASAIVDVAQHYDSDGVTNSQNKFDDYY